MGRNSGAQQRDRKKTKYIHTYKCAYIHSTTLTTTTEAAVATKLYKSREKLRKQQQLSLLAEILSRTLPLRLHCLLLLLVNNIRSLCGNVIFMRTKAAFFSFQKCYRRFILCTA